MPETKNQNSKPVDLKLEVVVIGVSDVDRAKAFYERLGWRLDADFVKGDEFRVIQFTPPNSQASIIFGKGLTAANPGAVKSLTLVVDDIDAARKDLIARGAAVSEVFHFVGGPFNDGVKDSRVTGRDTENRSYFSFVSFEDPDGNDYLVQEIQTRLPNREWKSKPDVATLAELLHETEQRHGLYEKTHAIHNWWDWYAVYLSARQNGTTREDAASAADRYMSDVHHVPLR
jgi:catechol 2,3-dioxygenase-like lactoylglutathione lyase family enzyme